MRISDWSSDVCSSDLGRTVGVNGNRFFEAESAAPLGDFLKSAYRKLAIDYPKFHKMDGLCKAAFIAAELIARESGPFERHTPLIFANRSSSYLADSRDANEIFRADDPVASPATIDRKSVVEGKGVTGR